MRVSVTVHNVPANVERSLEPGYIVARYVDGDLWYYGFYEDVDRAVLVASELGNGLVLEVNK